MYGALLSSPRYGCSLLDRQQHCTNYGLIITCNRYDLPAKLIGSDSAGAAGAAAGAAAASPLAATAAALPALLPALGGAAVLVLYCG